VAAALGIPVAPDGLVRTLFRVRGLHSGGSVLGALRSIGLSPLVEEPTCIVLGRPVALVAAQRADRLREGRAGTGAHGRRHHRDADGDGSILATETRVAAMDARSRRAFRGYWLAVGPFSRSSAGAGSQQRSAPSRDGSRARAVSAFLFGAMSVGLKMGLARHSDVEARDRRRWSARSRPRS
jgi:hypothetical protein